MGEKKDLTGQRFGYLETLERIIKENKRGQKLIYYRCKCHKCGEETLILDWYLTSGKRTTCRCSLMNGALARRKDLTGMKFGTLTVVEMLYGYKRTPDSKPKTFCRCVCDCGNEVIRNAYKLKESKLPSCGCMKKQIVKDSCGIDIDGKKFGRLTVIETLWEETPVKVRCICDCGNEIIVSKKDVASGHTQSCGCLHKERTSESNTKDVAGYINEYGIRILNPVEQNQRGVWLWECECHCGNHFVALPADIKSGKTRSCGCLKSSSCEVIIEEFLKENNVNYETQVSFDDCKHKYKLRFDFGIYDNNNNLITLIEYDGKQHYAPIEFFGGAKGFKETKTRDEIKNKYCKENHIPLHRLPYTLSVDEIKNKLTNIIYA